MNWYQLPVPLPGRDSRIAVRKENDSAMIAKISTPNAQPGVDSGSCSCSLWLPSYSENRPPTLNRTRATTNE
jgi:hypothetical protein